MYLVCWNHDCRQTYHSSKFTVDDRNVDCEKCGGTLISNSGKVVLCGIPNVIKTVNPERAEENRRRFEGEI
jgi:hypothetical protein